MKQKTIGILGLGWLGTALASELIQQGHRVKGTTTSHHKIAELNTNLIETYYLELGQDKIYGDLASFLTGIDSLYINITPGLRAQPDSDFAYRIGLLSSFIKVYDIPQVIFISSTSVFKDQDNLPSYSEKEVPNATTNNGMKIAAAEKRLLQHLPHATIIRPCGLIGGTRHPIHMLAGRTHVKNPKAPINLVTREHLIAISSAVINNKIDTPIIHAISEPHEPREIYYHRIAQELGVSPPVFDHNASSLGKKIVSIVSLA